MTDRCEWATASGASLDASATSRAFFQGNRFLLEPLVQLVVDFGAVRARRRSLCGSRTVWVVAGRRRHARRHTRRGGSRQRCGPAGQRRALRLDGSASSGAASSRTCDGERLAAMPIPRDAKARSSSIRHAPVCRRRRWLAYLRHAPGESSTSRATSPPSRETRERCSTRAMSFRGERDRSVSRIRRTSRPSRSFARSEG